MLKDSKRESSRRVLKLLRTGIKPQFVGTAEADRKKIEQVRATLARESAPRKEVEAKLTGRVPQEVEFKNHRSCYENASLGVREVVKMVVNRTLEVYGPKDGKPKVVNPLGVEFKYETLREVLTFLTNGAYFSTWDFKAGYYHVLIHPAYRKYFGIKVGEVYMHYNVMCFGWSEACYLYTLLTQEAAKELRIRSVPVSSYLDDGLTGSADFWRAVWETVFGVKVLTLLGAVFSIPNRPFFAAIQGKLSWDDVFPTLQAARAAAQLFIDNLPAWNGRAWFPRRVAVEAGSDASDTGFGGTIRVPGAQKIAVVGSLSEEERLISSTARETLAFVRVLREALDRAGDALRGGAVLLTGNNQSAVSAVNAMNSRTPDVNAALHQLFELCVRGDSMSSPSGSRARSCKRRTI
ncbi:DNA/RNA polymerase superfamily protein with reverse transcriptase domain [Klebsormidium nitens]|uniref:DNA/RNA polymerase superfamily protein with reverse transcriptase domain n=1 Tax=Klebsormidium nitens TaxID=105231 RepID=A0A1Y1I8H1_KLENI|nr:DNA/RNA polymerase superfamily protein with reverse transcriptase domain [Klebsormidium nitens]|eukprot:GAQ86252.1 DNA/RNA polymerase superfamily protein with reverse transcriptase domain [Klebsormidium nitens]